MKNSEKDLSFEALLDYLRHNRNFDFRGYKRTNLARRVRKRMAMVGVRRFDEYLDHLEVHPDEFPLLFNTILINVTAFFRDAPAWDYLGREIVPRIVKGAGSADAVRVWSAGCASGEEAYTLAMVLSEALGFDAFRRRVKIYATDIDQEALAHARQAVYEPADIEPVPDELRKKYFEPTGAGVAFRGDLRRAVIFGRHDLFKDAPISRLDLLVCRNTLMYFNAEAQSRIMARFRYAMKDSGFLFLGKAEMLLTQSGLFTPVELKHRIFVPVARRPGLRDHVAPPENAGNGTAAPCVDPDNRFREAAFEAQPDATIAIDARGTLAYANRQARRLFGIAANDVGRPLQDMEISYRPVELRSLIERALLERTAVTVNDAPRTMPGGETQYFDVHVIPLRENDGGPSGAGVVFRDVTRNRELQESLRQAKIALTTANEELQSTNEELETTNEELQSTNEELETTNEELHSTNEEMETMNEELQSTNEELQTMNDELRVRTDDLKDQGAFTDSILACLRVGLVAVDRGGIVRAWNHRAEDLWGLRTAEVLGKAFLGLDIGLPVEKLKAHMRAVLNGQDRFKEVTVQAVTRRGKSISCQITCTPRMDPAGKPQGVILLMDEE